MSTEIAVSIFALFALNIWQFWFWSRQNHRLVDKIMSRNYAEYVQTEHLATTSPQSKTQTNQIQFQHDPVLDELNSMI
jgi:hypothetical protein